MLKYLPCLTGGLVVAACALGLVVSSARAAQDTEAPIPDANAHNIKTVFIIVMENHNWTGDGKRSIKGNPAASYINFTLLPESSHAENYSNPPGNHPSLPNYLWLEAGSNFGIRNDNTPASNHQSTREHLVTLLEHAGISWKSYDENIGGKVCPLTDEGSRDANGNPLYGVRHDPFVYFDDVTGNRNAKSSYCIAHIRPFTELQRDLADNHVARYNFITPNVCDDMHDSCGGDPIAHGDAWLRKNVPQILKSTAYRSGGALFITWDEAASKDGPIPLLVLSPFAKGNHYSNRLHYTHGSLLRTVQEIFGVTPLMRDAAHEQDLRSMFTAFP
jgi:phospholipase C